MTSHQWCYTSFEHSIDKILISNSSVCDWLIYRSSDFNLWKAYVRTFYGYLHYSPSWDSWQKFTWNNNNEDIQSAFLMIKNPQFYGKTSIHE